MTDKEERQHVIEILQKEKKTALHDNRWAFDYAISSIKTDLKYDLLYEDNQIDDADKMITEDNSCLATIHTEGLDEEIRCVMCSNRMKSDRGCDGSCVVDNAMYKKVMDAIERRIQPTTKNNLGIDWDELKRKILMEVDGGTDDKWLRYADVCDNISNSIDEYIANMGEVSKALGEEPRWIPVSERLPEDSGEYLVSVTDKEDEDYKQVGVAWFAHPKDYDIQDGEWRELMIDEIVVAWMPKPKAYSEVEE